MTPNFLLLGAAGYVAWRHVEVIHATGGNLVAACDPYDNVGHLDKHFPFCKFRTNINKLTAELKEEGTKIDYIVICTPNDTHHEIANMALVFPGAGLIIEKPLALGAGAARSLLDLEALMPGRCKVWGISQLRYHRNMKRLKLIKQDIDLGNRPPAKIMVNYCTPRGDWYFQSWKGKEERSGGLVYNIGIHLLDILCLAFGQPRLDQVSMIHASDHGLSFALHWDHYGVADIYITIAPDRLPDRSFMVDDEQLDFTSDFENLHIRNYQAIMDGTGPDVESLIPALEVADQVRTQAKEFMVNANLLRDPSPPPAVHNLRNHKPAIPAAAAKGHGAGRGGCGG